MDSQVLPPVDVSSAPWPDKPKKLAPWHVATLIVGVPIIAFLSCVGANTVAHHFIDTPAVKASATAAHRQTPKPHHTKPPAPAYNLAGYQAAISGTEEQSLVTALNRFRADIRRLDFQSVTTDSLTLTGAANAWLAVLRNTNPPPAYQGQKLTYLMAAILARRAATTTQGAISSANLASLQKGLALANKARAALAQAAASAAQGPTGS